MAPRTGERGLDIGCGFGLLACELARDVGPTGRIMGVDAVPDMIIACEERARHDAVTGRTEFRQADPEAVPASPGGFDFVTAMQVYEYMADVERGHDRRGRAVRGQPGRDQRRGGRPLGRGRAEPGHPGRVLLRPLALPLPGRSRAHVAGERGMRIEVDMVQDEGGIFRATAVSYFYFSVTAPTEKEALGLLLEAVGKYLKKTRPERA